MPNRSDFLHNFVEHTQVAPERAFIDRLQIVVGDWGLYGSSEQVCGTVTNLRNQEVVTPEGECIPLFRGDEYLSHKQQLKIRFSSADNDTKHVNRSPLIAGRLWYSDPYRRAERIRSATSTFEFQTTLNLTRFVQAQKFKLKTKIKRKPRLVSELALAIDPDPDWFKAEVPLTPATNLIVGPWTKYAY